MNVLSAVTPPLAGRLRWLLELAPVEVPQAAGSVLVFASIALLFIARGLRRGMRHTWIAALALLAISLITNLTKGLDVEEALCSAAVAFVLIHYRHAFRVRPAPAAFRRAAGVAVAGVVGAVAFGALLVTVVGVHHRSGDSGSVTALVERLAGDNALPLPAANPLVTPALGALGIALVVAIGATLVAPHRRRSRPAEEHRAERELARAIVVRESADTLGFFALRNDRDWFFTGHTVVAYAVHNGVCLVSPDPIGPAAEREDAWADFCAFADANGWSVAVMAASASWLPTYQAMGMRAIYLGDEAIVDCRSFTLAGGAMKSLRGAHNRVSKAGFRVELVDPNDLDAVRRREVLELLPETHRGAIERGFSMTLSRVFDPDDHGLLLALARDAQGRAQAVCQFVPCAEIRGFSLDLMRRRHDEALPNGVIDFVIIETIEHLRQQGYEGLGLNFAVLRAVVSGERNESAWHGIERRVLARLSESAQIESLWRFNAKFHPEWQPRWVVVDAVEHVPAQGFAIADAESIWELPVVGGLIERRARRRAAAVT
ncbi:MAG TPA: phosphatidylglycerol lysyltransferase domain-containing protein [Acidimicrobiales bacterium]|nr:phosphatidylglycerol lysyltransferase domain-containing protein [Acidimicrobiales bacterium]